MTDLVLVRHGETEWHQDNRYAGVSDIALTPRGVSQAGQLARWAQGADLSAVWTSTLTRARLTAEACSTAVGLPLVVDARLRELDFGDGEGLTADEMAVRFPAALHAFRVDPVGDHLPGGEDPEGAAGRFLASIDDAARQHPEGRVLLVAHTTVIRLALCALIGVPLKEYRRVFPVVGNCALTRLSYRSGQAAVLEFNTPVDRVAAPPVALSAPAVLHPS